MNPRYLSYCAANDKTPKAMLEHDTRHYPGGKMCGFMRWISAEIGEWKRANTVGLHMSDRDQANFTAWLEEKHGQAKIVVEKG